MYIDANIFILAINDSGIRGEKARNIISAFEHGKQSGITSILVLDEVFWTMVKLRNKDDAVKSWKLILSIPNLKVVSIDENTAVRAILLLEKYDIHPRDAIHAACCIENGVSTILSEDKDFDRIEAIKRIEL